MKQGRNIILVCILLLSMLFPFNDSAIAATGRQNNYPIVLVHGFLGWGRDEVFGFKYWGGFFDVQEDLRGLGYTTYTAAVGPVSSNWDRACELYAQIKGGKVDYGKAHAARHGHARFGRTYAGFYTQWGTTDVNTGGIRKVHLVGHSMGGQTIRVLVQLLENGAQQEIAATSANELSPLFNGIKKSWVASATSISSPHNGTTLTKGVNGLFPHIQEMVALIAGATGAGQQTIYDFKLDQWGLKRLPGEPLNDYARRVLDSNLLNSTTDISARDLDPDGAKELNAWVRAQSDVYYFSVATEATFEEIFTRHEVPEITMDPLLTISAFFMGAYTRNEPGQVVIDRSWWKNDGVVNTISMVGPTVGSTDRIISYNGVPQLGKWNYLGLVDSYDHIDIVGINTLRNIKDIYRNLAVFLGQLPK
ncbi:MAG: lipase [Acidobacteriota bacterium]